MAEALRDGGRIVVDQLLLDGIDTMFCVPGESFLPVLDALYDAPARVVVCRQEGGAAHMAAAYGRLTGRPGVCLVTRGPGATNAIVGVHTAAQDSAPMLLLVGQVERAHRGREALQELDVARVLERVRAADLVVAVGSRLDELSMAGCRLLELRIDPDAITTTTTLSKIRAERSEAGRPRGEA